MENKYNFPEGWTEHIKDSNKMSTLTLDREQLGCLMNQISNGCVNELMNPVYTATYKAIADAYWERK